MNQNKLNHFKNILLNMRDQLGDEYERTVEASSEEFGGDLPDISDEATRTIGRRILLELGDRNFDSLNQIEDALERIDSGEYGICAECGEDIPEKRLELVPFALFCVSCKERLENQKD